MMMLTKELKEKMPMMNEMSEKQATEIPIIVKFFQPWGHWTWYATEGYARLKDGREVKMSEAKDDEVADYIFFGYVRGDFNELGTFSLNELVSVNGPMGLKIERDLHFGGHNLNEVYERRL